MGIQKKWFNFNGIWHRLELKFKITNFQALFFLYRVNSERSCQKGATKVDVISMIYIKFNDTNKLNDKEKVYIAKKVAPSRGDFN